MHKFLCLYLKYLSVSSWSSHYHLLLCCHQSFLSCLFQEVPYSQKRLSELLQNLCFFVCIWNIFQFFLWVLIIIFFGDVTNVFCPVCFKRFFIPQNLCLFCIRICISLSYMKYLPIFPWSSNYHLLWCCPQSFLSCPF